jgi:hypothetical protein
VQSLAGPWSSQQDITAEATRTFFSQVRLRPRGLRAS